MDIGRNVMFNPKLRYSRGNNPLRPCMQSQRAIHIFMNRNKVCSFCLGFKLKTYIPKNKWRNPAKTGIKWLRLFIR